MNDVRNRRIGRILTGRPATDGDGVKLLRVFSAQSDDSMGAMDPFLLLDEFAADEAADYIGGFPEHPHRGFETVTYMLEGSMEHRDHLGNRGELVPGSVQWMTAARGIIHSEMPLQQDGRMHGFQLWINLPASEKMGNPGYQEYTPEALPVYRLASGGSIRAIAGRLHIDGMDVAGPVAGIATDPVYLDVQLPAGTCMDVPVPESHTVLTYVFEGSLEVNGGRVGRGQLAQWVEGGPLALATSEGTRLLLLAGRPIGEPVVQYGPFVMNSVAEIEQALRDYRDGRLTQS